MENREVDLSEVLAFREEKAMIQNRMRDSAQAGVIVSLGMNIPGPVKSGSSIRRAFDEGCRLLEEAILGTGGRLLQKELLEGRAGYAAVYLTAGAGAEELKHRTVFLEETHRIGRLWDIDVAYEDGTAVLRQAIGAEKRKCFLCGRDAKECGRSREHSVSELQQKVRELLEEWEGDGR